MELLAGDAVVVLVVVRQLSGCSAPGGHSNLLHRMSCTNQGRQQGRCAPGRLLQSGGAPVCSSSAMTMKFFTPLRCTHSTHVCSMPNLPSGVINALFDT